jgi:hypothetical protein
MMLADRLKPLVLLVMFVCTSCVPQQLSCIADAAVPIPAGLCDRHIQMM